MPTYQSYGFARNTGIAVRRLVGATGTRCGVADFFSSYLRSNHFFGRNVHGEHFICRCLGNFGQRLKRLSRPVTTMRPEHFAVCELLEYVVLAVHMKTDE
jgi:hypothetical protein